MACIRAPRSVRGSIDDIKADSTRNIVQVILSFRSYLFRREMSNMSNMFATILLIYKCLFANLLLLLLFLVMEKQMCN